MSFPLEAELSEGCFFPPLFHAGQHTEYEDGWAASYNTTHPEATKSTDVRKRNYRVSAVTECVNSFGEQKGKKGRSFSIVWGFLVCGFFGFVLTIHKGQEVLHLHSLILVMSYISVSTFLREDGGHHHPFPTGPFLSLQNT